MCVRCCPKCECVVSTDVTTLGGPSERMCVECGTIIVPFRFFRRDGRRELVLSPRWVRSGAYTPPGTLEATLIIHDRHLVAVYGGGMGAPYPLPPSPEELLRYGLAGW